MTANQAWHTASVGSHRCWGQGQLFMEIQTPEVTSNGGFKVFRPNIFRNSGCPDGFIAYSMIGSFGSHILSNTWQDPVDIRHPPVISGEGQ